MATKKVTPAMKKKAYAAAEKVESKVVKAKEIKAGLKLIKGGKK